MQIIIKAFKSINSLVFASMPKACYSENSSLLCPFPAKPRQIPSRLAVSPIKPVGLNLTCHMTSHVTSSEMTVAAVISDITNTESSISNSDSRTPHTKLRIL
jgi:hypothetical protein